MLKRLDPQDVCDQGKTYGEVIREGIEDWIFGSIINGIRSGKVIVEITNLQASENLFTFDVRFFLAARAMFSPQKDYYVSNPEPTLFADVNMIVNQSTLTRFGVECALCTVAKISKKYLDQIC